MATLCIPRWCLPSPSLAYNALQSVEATVGAGCIILCRVAANFSDSVVLARLRGYLPGSESTSCDSAADISLLVVDRGVPGMAAVLVPFMFNHETMSAGASPTYREAKHTTQDNISRQQRWRYRDRETGRKMN